MPHFNLKFTASLLILCFGFVEFLVFNEEVFIFICFFIFFNLITLLAGQSIRQIFQETGSNLEKNFLHASNESYEGLSNLAIIKKQAITSILRVLVFFKAFKNIAIQKGLLVAVESYVQSLRFCTLALDAFDSYGKTSNASLDVITQTLNINSKAGLKEFYLIDASISSPKKFFHLSKVKTTSAEQITS